MKSKPARILLREVSPRDGLQNEARPIPTATKIRFVEMLWATGTPYLEVTSFVKPSWIPQLADAEEVFTAVAGLQEEGRRLVALVPNLRGYERALASGCQNIAVFTSASEAFNQKNTNASIDHSLERFAVVCRAAHRDNIWVRGYVSTAFSCPYSGEVPPESVALIARKLADLGCAEIVISDTTGHAVPDQVTQVLTHTLRDLSANVLALHMHDTAGRALKNIQEGWRMGIRRFDSAAGGLGGCPYSPGAPGNVRTESLLEYFEQLGVPTGVDLDAVRSASRFIREQFPEPA